MEGYVGEVRLFAGNFAPKNWAFCDGSLLRVDSNAALFNVLVDNYGGDGKTTFGLPDLRGRLVLGAGPLYGLAQTPGAAQVPTQPPITAQEAPPGNSYATVTSVAPASGDNVQPVLGLNYIICLHGIFPSPSGSGLLGCVGEIRLFAGYLTPSGWALCDGSLLSIAVKRPLFDVIGNTYGGDGQETFALPDLRDRAAIGVGQASGLSEYELGQMAGADQVPTESMQVARWIDGLTLNSVDPARGNNLQPALVLNFAICTDGVFPRYGD